MRQLHRLFHKLFWNLLGLLGVMLVAMIIIYVYAEIQLPDVEKLKDIHLQVPLRIYTADGLLIDQFGTKRRIPVELADIPKPLVNAVLATEDARFYQHSGVDLVGLLRASLVLISSGKKVQGASTITMQVARNFYLSREKTYARKIKEILLALKIDRELTKDKVLELYLNKIYFGYRAYGVAVAAQTYYGKSLDQLSLAQMAMIAGLPQAPSRNNPINKPAAALKRRNHVLLRMEDLGFITAQQYQNAVNEPDEAYFHHDEIQVAAPYVAEMVRETMVEQYGDEAYEKGLAVYTTLNSAWQQFSDQAVQDGLMAFDKRHGFRKPTKNFAGLDRSAWMTALQDEQSSHGLVPAIVTALDDQAMQVLLQNGAIINIDWRGLSWAKPALPNGRVGAAPNHASDIVTIGDLVFVIKNTHDQWRLSQLPEAQAALIALQPSDGAIKALSGGFDYQLTTFNRVVQAERQTGSVFKPFIYSAALHKGLTLASIINDAPIVKQDSGEDAWWRPTNDSLRFYGPTPLRVGFIESRNLVSIRLLQRIGIPYAVDYLTRFGFDKNALPHSLSLALGSGVSTPLQVAAGYAVFANGGYSVKPYFIDRISDEHGRLIYQASPPRVANPCVDTTAENHLPPRAISAQDAYLMTQAMRDVIQRGTGRGAKVLKRRDIAGKTGTTNDQADAWFSGFNSCLVTTVWVGFDNMRSLHEYGSQAALPIWVKFMRKALKNLPVVTMKEPPGIVTARIDPHTGLLALPSQPDAVFEIFRQQYAPQQYSVAAPTPADDIDTNAVSSGEDAIF